MQPTLVTPSMNYWLLRPDPALRPYVHGYYVAEPRPGGSDNPGFRELELILPDGYAEIVFCGSGRYERWPLHKPEAVELVGASHVVAGRVGSAVTRDVENVWLAGVKLDPWLLTELVRTPLDEVAGDLVSLADFGNKKLNALEDAVLSSTSPARIGAVLDGFFKRVLAELTYCDPVVAQLRQAIDLQQGAIPIMNWAQAHAVDARTLQRRFARIMGMTPKRYARVIRFRHAYRSVMRHRSYGSAIEIDGFYDQSHFLKEFREFTGTSPQARRSGLEAQGVSISEHQISADASVESL